MLASLKIVLEIAELLSAVAVIVVAIRMFAHYRRPRWHSVVRERQLPFVLLVTFLVAAIKIGEEVIEDETRPIDAGILWALHEHVPVAWRGFFEAITLTGSSSCLMPLTALVIVVLLWRGRRAEAILAGASVASAATVIYVIKLVVARDRPALWQTEYYWGSSFPSGHTLASAAFAAAIVICVSRVAPRARTTVGFLMFAWVSLVALSRMVLGVHWPTDVAAAICIGVSLPMLIDFVQGHRNSSTHRALNKSKTST